MKRGSSRKHLILLLALVGTLTAQSMLVHSGQVVLEGARVALCVVYLYAFFIVFGRGRDRRIALVLFLPVVASNVAISVLGASRLDLPLEVLHHASIIVFLGFAVRVIMAELFSARVIRGDDVLGAVCGYILAGVAWSHLYGMAYLFAPEAFEVNPAIVPQLAEWHARQTLFDYLSFTTLTSIGYSDITPAGPPMYSFTWIEVVFGQFYMAVVVAQLVGLKLAQAVRGEPRGVGRRWLRRACLLGQWRRMARQGRFAGAILLAVMTKHIRVVGRWRVLVAFLSVVVTASLARAVPVELRDQNDTRYFINTDVEPAIDVSNASGAVTDATFVKPVTVTSYFIGLTPFGFFLTTYSVQYELDIPLTNAFGGFNGLQIAAVNGTPPPAPEIYRPGEVLAAQECEQNGTNRQLVFPVQAFPTLGLQVQRKVFVPNNGDFVRWLNIVTNTGTTAADVTIMLQGLLGSGANTQVTSTSTGDSALGAADLWFATAQEVAPGARSTEPRIGYVLQGEGATAPATALGLNATGQTAATFIPTIQPGESVILLTFVTVQGSSKQAKKTAENLVTLPSKAVHCLTEEELSQVVNFAPLTPPVTSKATIKLNFKKTGEDTVKWKGTLEIGAGINLQGLPITVDVGGVSQAFLLNKNGSANDGGGNKFNLKAKVKDGVTVAGNHKFSFNLKGDFQTALEPYGFTNATVEDVAVSAPVSFSTTAGQYATTQAFTYNAKQDKSGTAKDSDS